MKKLIILISMLQCIEGQNDLKSLIDKKLNSPMIEQNITKKPNQNITKNIMPQMDTQPPVVIQRIGIGILRAIIEGIAH